ncbi:coproporphyrinogen dehydrogenase HemZ [Mobilitalea sibirica]|uniref:Coproporphyrinogen dehydrogenase HemZ n=1 Tax=Mobilitalea sibirica TaxID=1462919 RepID=A0A8J7L1X9_9FIRM|nr:coproporphyrinogen dehydrogenase HemZ [Mobilitalea sibirica]MBH1939533.1 coproporphyrinogen dehydrogenase HemZ [Mobilitalea sibirica]
MIQIILSDKAYENDVYPLVKAFYPNEIIKVYSEKEETKVEQSDSWMIDIALENHNNKGEIVANMAEIYIIRVLFHPELISITMVNPAGEEGIQSIDTLEIEDQKSQYKNAMKRLLYKMLSHKLNKKLPWGILTGIRPTKLVYEMLEQGFTEEKIRLQMQEEYLCSLEKIQLSIEIARREKKLLEDMDYRNGYSLYIGIPFCPSTCLYCSFPSYSIERFSNYVDRYLCALHKEIAYGATCFPDKKLTTVYFGGGTPTTLSAEQLDKLIESVKKHFDFTHVREFCVEAGRPDSITREKLVVLKKRGVNRISINPQSMHQKTLDLIGRKHSVEQIREAFTMARAIGHDNINMDIIIGLPGENVIDVKETLTEIEKLNPEGLTVHTLAIKRAARLNTDKDNYTELQATDTSDMLEATFEFAKNNDYLPYYLYRQKNMADNLENIGYARYGLEGLYNILIMEEKQTILALGAGAMSKFVFHNENRIERVDNVKSVMDYISRIDEMIQRKKDFLGKNRKL